ncbi:hypothetical protein LOK49_LG06G02853 [Camellia lanceoleosa]|uniref:Uncharacterized protein n=1 Tax=Camellia lanceoleosa TaxID=1840588 RepID=A0ACC0HDE6_9ERIC|nr:hypothetical protein LOK49_LG06G02853 [Camellia lanceoleosa]
MIEELDTDLDDFINLEKFASFYKGGGDIAGTAGDDNALFLTLASSDAPFIIAHKKATLTKLKSDVERVFASIDIYDQGSVYAIPPFPFSLVFFDLSEFYSRNNQHA